MKRWSRRLGLLLLALAVPGGALPAQERVGQAPLEEVLALSGVATVLAGAGAQVWARVSEVAAALPPGGEERIMEAVRAEFTLPLLYADVLEVLESEGDAERVAQLLSLLTEGATGELRRLSGEQGPGDPWTTSPGTGGEPPPPGAPGPGPALDGDPGHGRLLPPGGESARRAAHDILDAGLDADAPYVPLGDVEVTDLRETLAAGAFLSHLRQLQQVPDSLIEAAVAEGLSPPAAWWAEAWGLGGWRGHPPGGGAGGRTPRDGGRVPLREPPRCGEEGRPDPHEGGAGRGRRRRSPPGGE
jgi:hypothetical protein